MLTKPAPGEYIEYQLTADDGECLPPMTTYALADRYQVSRSALEHRLNFCTEQGKDLRMAGKIWTVRARIRRTIWEIYDEEGALLYRGQRAGALEVAGMDDKAFSRAHSRMVDDADYLTPAGHFFIRLVDVGDYF